MVERSRKFKRGPWAVVAISGAVAAVVSLSPCWSNLTNREGHSSDSESREICAKLQGQTYCFEKELIYVPPEKNGHGFLLQLPLGEFDSDCNRTRKLYPFVLVLFEHSRIPRPENFQAGIDASRSIAKIETFKPESFIFKKSRSEFEECEPSKGGPERVDCHRVIDWSGILVEFTYDRQCKKQMRNFAKNLENFLEEGRR